MRQPFKRREFLQLTLAGTALGFGGAGMCAWGAGPRATTLISPGCRRSKVKVARLYLAIPGSGWPTPKLDLEAELRTYKAAFESLKGALADVEFVIDQMVTSPAQIEAMKNELKGVDGILVIHLNIGIWSILAEILKARRPTMFFAVPYSGHEWASFGTLEKQPEGALMEALLTSDLQQLAVAIRPFRAIHHLREAKILDVTSRTPSQYIAEVKTKFGTEIKQVSLERVEAAYQAVNDDAARAEAERWIAGAVKVVEPTEAEIVKSCKLALAFETLLDEEDATVMTADCYGTMWDKTIKLPAYPCLGFSRLNSMGYGGICESDLQCAMTHIIFQGLAGRPGFISDPTVDESTNSIVLAHCQGTVKMEGPDQPPARYQIRTILERQEGVVPQVFFPVGPKVTQAKLVSPDQIVYFTGTATDSPDVERGCRSKITVKLDGDAEKLWKNWSYGLHRVTCYGDIVKDLERFCRFTKIKLVNEAV
jgi:L-fucose isomerase-like protein